MWRVSLDRRDVNCIRCVNQDLIETHVCYSFKGLSRVMGVEIYGSA
jgi:hypothetical protein